MEERLWFKALVAIAFVYSVLTGGTGCTTTTRIVEGPVVNAPSNACDAEVGCGPTVWRIVQLTKYAFEKARGVRVPEGIWDDLAEINVVYHELICPTYNNPDQMCSGTLRKVDGKYRIYVQHKGCLATSSLAHEILHYVLQRLEGDPDAEHADDTIFYGEDSIQRRSQAAAAHEGLCR